VFDSQSGVQLAQLSGYPCVSSLTNLTLNNVAGLPLGGVINVVMNITGPCELCSREIFIPLKVKQKENRIPDNNILSIAVLLIGILFVLSKQKRK
jgi:hypothetical protein